MGIIMKTIQDEFIKNYQSILLNTLDKIFEFYVILNAAKLMDNNITSTLNKIYDFTQSYLISCGFTKEDLIELNVVDEAFDIFQVNYSYSRSLRNNGLNNCDNRKRSVYIEISKAIYEMNSGKLADHYSDNASSYEEQTTDTPTTKEFFKALKYEFPCLNIIRMVDIINAPKMEELIPIVEKAYSYNLALTKAGATENECVRMTAIDSMLRLVDFYPERLYIGLQYFFHQSEASKTIDNMAISFNHQILDTDMQNALDNIAFQFEKFKSFYHNHETSIAGNIKLERIKPFMYKPVRSNKYIKQLNSIEGTFDAMLAWERLNIGSGKSQAKIIADIYKSRAETGQLVISEEDFKRKVRDRLKDINEYINEQHSFLISMPDGEPDDYEQF